MREKYKDKFIKEGKDFENYLETINRQIKDIENLVNEFQICKNTTNFKKVNILELINKSLDFIKLTSQIKLT